ncbi:MAG: helix-turn-helix transcriptional regulator [Candidatus Heimdallarchaeota archaeon]|nr:MAG: helix-turn-helix transcriptional regulator [Candidatus Heimdallarchaeota archaeon]
MTTAGFHGPPPFPPFRFGKHHRPHGLSHRGPPFPLTREAFRNLKTFFMLTILADNTDGITGYQIQDKYKIPRSNVIRILGKLEELEYVDTEESVVSGRAQKKYKLTKKGKDFLDELKEKWATEFAFFSELAPPDRYGDPFIRPGLYRKMLADIDEFQSPEDAIDYFSGYRSHIKRRLARLEKRSERLSKTKTELDNIIQEINSWDELNIDELKGLLEKIKEKAKQESTETQ